MRDVEADVGRGEAASEGESGSSHELRQWIAQARSEASECEDGRPLLAPAAPPRAARLGAGLVAGPLLLMALGCAALWARQGRFGGPPRNLGVDLGDAARAALRLYPLQQQAIPKYEQALDCYCGRDGKIGSTFRGVGKQRCQELCQDEPRCVAFEMYKGGDDCTLRPHCPDPRKSDVGTFLVLFAHRNNGSLYPADLAIMCSGHHDGPTLPPSGMLPSVTLAPHPAGRHATSPPPPPPSVQQQSTTPPPPTLPPFTLPPLLHRSRGAGTGSSGGVPASPFWDWSELSGDGKADSTTPMYRMQEGSNVFISPPFGGTRVVQSETCSEAFDMLWTDGCELRHVLWQFTRTCQGSFFQDWKRACSSWFGAGLTGKEEVDQAFVEECSNIGKVFEDKDWLGSYAAPTSAEEAKVCFTCTSVTCIVLANYTGPKLSFDGNSPTPSPALPPSTQGHWSPDGSANHCRPMEGAQVVGVQKRVRRELHRWTDEEWKKFASTIQTMKETGVYSQFAANFSRRLSPELPEFSLLQSLPWMRHFLLDFETEMQRVASDCSLTLPYWSPSMEASPAALQDSVLWSPERLGGKPVCPSGGPPCDKATVSNGVRDCISDNAVFCLRDGLASGWSVEGETECACVHRSPSLNASLLTMPSVFRFVGGAGDLMSISSRLGALAAYLHCQVAGSASTLCNPKTAIWDPLFLLLQADIDRMFAGWQRYRALKHWGDTTKCSGCEQLMTLYGQSIEDMLGTFSEGSRGQYIELPKSSPRVAVTYQEAYDPAVWI